MSYTLIISDITYDEVQHVGRIMRNYQADLFEKKIDMFIESDLEAIAYYDEQIAEHDKVLAKMEWKKE